MSNEPTTRDLQKALWSAADALRGSMDPSEYKLVVLPLIFLKYISDTFEQQHAKLAAEADQGADPEDPDEYRAINAFWVPEKPAGLISVTTPAKKKSASSSTMPWPPSKQTTPR